MLLSHDAEIDGTRNDLYIEIIVIKYYQSEICLLSCIDW